MKRKSTIFSLMIFTVFCFSGISSAQGIFKGFSLKLSGGLGTMSIGDLNELFESNEAFLNAILAMELPEGITYTRSGEYPKLNTGLDLEGAFIAHLTDNFGVGIEFGYMQRTTEGDVTLSLSIEGEDLSVSWKYKPKLNVYPLFLTVYYFHPVMEKLNIFISGGAGLYFGKQSWGNSYTESAQGFSIASTDTANFSGTAFGFKGGLGVEYQVSNNIALFVEGNRRFGTIGSWDGDQTYVENGYTDEHSGTLWYLKYFDDYLNIDMIEYRISDKKPDATYYSSVRKWKTKLSGFTGIIGIRISFGTRK